MNNISKEFLAHREKNKLLESRKNRPEKTLEELSAAFDNWTKETRSLLESLNLRTKND
jgi:hypothetical protein